MRLGRKRDLDERLRSTKQVERRGRTWWRPWKRADKPKPHQKFQQRAAEVRRRPWRVVAVLALVLALVGGVVYLFGWSNAFVVQEVALTGADGEVAEVAHTNAAIPVGRPLARVDTDSVEERVLEDLRVATVDVGRSWPSTVTLELTLREPALAVKQSGAKGVQLADAQGVVYDSVEKAPKGVPTVRAPKGDLAPADLQTLMLLPEALPPAIAKQVEDLKLKGPGDIQFELGNFTVKWGDGSTPELKARVLEALLEQEGIDPEAEVDPAVGEMSIDLSTPSTPVVTGLQTAEPNN